MMHERFVGSGEVSWRRGVGLAGIVAAVALVGCGDPTLDAYNQPWRDPVLPLMHSHEAVGEPCKGRADGWADLQGATGTFTFTEIQHAVFSHLSNITTFAIGPEIHGRAIGVCSPQRGLLTLEIRVEKPIMELGTIPVDENLSVKTANRAPIDEDEVDYAVSGSLTLEGFDPVSASLCGRLEAEFSNGGAISGPFEARSYCLQ